MTTSSAASITTLELFKQWYKNELQGLWKELAGYEDRYKNKTRSDVSYRYNICLEPVLGQEGNEGGDLCSHRSCYSSGISFQDKCRTHMAKFVKKQMEDIKDPEFDWYGVATTMAEVNYNRSLEAIMRQRSLVSKRRKAIGNDGEPLPLVTFASVEELETQKQCSTLKRKGHWACTKTDCQKRATFGGYVNDKPVGIVCGDHSDESVQCITKKRCKGAGCGEAAAFPEGLGMDRLCRYHFVRWAEDLYVNVSDFTHDQQ